MMLSDRLTRMGVLKDDFAIVAVDNSFVIQDRDEHIYKSAGVDAESIARAAIGKL